MAAAPPFRMIIIPIFGDFIFWKSLNYKNHLRDNLALLHQYCYDQVHQGLRDKHQIVEELDEVESLMSGFVDESLW